MIFLVYNIITYNQIKNVTANIIIYKMQSDEIKKQNQNGSSNYQQQNKLLRQLYQQRMKARRQQPNQREIKQQQQIIIKPNLKSSKQVMNDEKFEHSQPNIELKGQKIFLNSLFYDMRENKPKSFIMLTSLFNQQVDKPKKYISQNIQSAFITTFGFETETFERLLKESHLKLVILNDSDEVGQNKIIKQYGGFKNLTVVLKAKHPQQKYGVFHTKLWFIKFKSFLRVVICTSNQHLMDWSVWQNAFWYQDFPLKDNAVKIENKQQQNKNSFDFNKDFYQTLLDVVTAMIPLKQLEDLTKIKLDNYLFDNIKVALIPSIPGRHNGEKIKKQGMCKVQQIMKKFNNTIDPVLTYQTTSLGVVDKKIVQDIYLHFCPQQKSFNLSNFRLIYPTKKYIQQETGGQASVLFLTSENFNKSDVGTKIFYKFDTNPQNPILGCIPHLKMIIIQSNKKSQGETEKGVVYLGSHNMTRAAWGRLQKQGSQIYIANSQLGLLFFDVDMKWVKSWTPFKYPPQPYSEKDVPFVRDFLN